MEISKEEQKKIINIIGNIMELTQDTTRSALYAQTQDSYKETHLKMAEEAADKIQQNLCDMADILGVPRYAYPGILPEHWGLV